MLLLLRLPLLLLTTPDVSTVSDQLCLALRTRTGTLMNMKTNTETKDNTRQDELRRPD